MLRCSRDRLATLLLARRGDKSPIDASVKFFQVSLDQDVAVTQACNFHTTGHATSQVRCQVGSAAGSL